MAASKLLLENGDFLELEDGSGVLLLDGIETAASAVLVDLDLIFNVNRTASFDMAINRTASLTMNINRTVSDDLKLTD